MSSTTFNYTIQTGPRPISSYDPNKGEDSDGLRKPEAVPATVIFENLPPPTSSAIFISRGATEESLEDALAIHETDYSDQEVDVTEDEEQQRRRRPHGSDAYQTELLQDNGFKIIEEAMATLDMDDLSSVGSSDEESAG